jgi:hypothetical protein
MWEIHEVKMATAIKEINLDDVAIQHCALRCSFRSPVLLVHIDNATCARRSKFIVSSSAKR